MNSLKDLIIKEHKERKEVIYSLVKDFKEIAMSIKKINEELENDEDFEDNDGEAHVSAHALSVVSDSIKDLLQVGIKNDDLIIKLIEIREKYNKSNDEEEDLKNSKDSSDFEKELIELQNK